MCPIRHTFHCHRPQADGLAETQWNDGQENEANHEESTDGEAAAIMPELCEIIRSCR